MSEPDDIEALLPWCAAGTLPDAERARVEAALKARPELGANFASAREERDETVALNESLGAPGAQVWARVMAGVEAAPRRTTLVARFAAALGFADRPVFALAMTAAAVLVLAQAAAIAVLLRPGARPPAYETVTAGRSDADALVAFAPGAAMGEIGELLARAGATISGGPKSGGLYEIRLATQPVTRAEIEAALKTLSASKLVTMALPGAGR